MISFSRLEKFPSQEVHLQEMMITILSGLEDLAFSLGYKGYKLFKRYKLFDNYSNYSIDLIIKKIDINMYFFRLSYEEYVNCHKIS